MALVTMKEMLDKAVKGNYAVGAFGASDLVMAMSAIQAAEATGTPIILLLELDLIFDNSRTLELNFAALNAMAEKAKVPVATILDHGPTYEECAQAIKYGFTTVMFDGSSLPMEENIAITKKVVELAHTVGVSVEGEIGHVGGAEGGATLEGVEVDTSNYTTPEEAKYFVEQTGVDALAVAVGTVHGTYKGIPKLDIERLRAIRAALPEVPLVLHGGSGLPDGEFQLAAQNGINKINIFTSIGKVGANTARRLLDEEDKYLVTMDKIVGAAVKDMQAAVEEHIKIFGTPRVID